MASTIAKPRSRKNLRELTCAIRQAYKLQTTPSFPLMKFMEYFLPVLIPGFEFQIIPDHEMGGCDGRTIPEEKTILLKQSVYDGACNDNHRDRFTVAHEIGHLFLHDNNHVSFARSNKKIRAFEDPEWQANTFAAELLIPVTLIKNLSPYEISTKFNVSIAAAKIQLQQLTCN